MRFLSTTLCLCLLALPAGGNASAVGAAARPDAERPWPWPDSADAVAAAPESHEVLIDNDRVRVLRVRIGPGEREPAHTHRWPSVMIVDGPARIRYYGADGELRFETPEGRELAPEPRPNWMGPEGLHAVENIDERPFLAWRIEVKPGAATSPGGAGSAAAALPEPELERFQQDVAWSPNGEWLAFSELEGGSEYDPANWSVWVVRPDGSERALVKRGALWVSWAPDGERLVFGSSPRENRDLYVTRRDGSELTRLTAEEGKDITPAWSPRGDRIAFSSERAGSLDLWTVAPDGSDPRRLTADPASDYNPFWSPDGSKIVFYREKGDNRDQIWWVAADGSEERPVTADDAHSVFPSFVPDGRIAFLSRKGDEPQQLVVAADDGSGRSHVGLVDSGLARWSPDGETIAFIAGRWPKSAIYLMDADGGNVRKIVN